MLPSQELQDELRELSGWKGEFYLGYLLRKLPFSDDGGGMSFGFAKDKDHWFLNFILTGIRGPKLQSSFNAEADTPENALCQLAIELFKQGILTKEDK